ncbi:MAG: DinB family protein [Bacteroidota bacterium]
MKKENYNRRHFLNTTAKLSLTTTGAMILPSSKAFNQPSKNSFEEERNVFGPRKGFSPQISTLVSMMDWMRYTILRPVKGLSVKDLDFVFDENSNSIGAMLWHLAATERYYQLNTFENLRWGSWSYEIKQEWDVPMNLGDMGRKKIKGNNIGFYLDKLKEVRENTLKELAKRDDKWLLAIDEGWGWGPTNNYCKWFHVVEHESNHNGQIKWLMKRLPSKN